MGAKAIEFISKLFSPNDEQLMWRVKLAGDPDAFAEIVRRWQPVLHRLCLRLTSNDSIAEDIAQESFLRLFSHRGSYRAEGAFGTYLRRIAINLCYDQLRDSSRRKEVQLEEEEGGFETHIASDHPGPDEDTAKRDMAGRVRDAVGRLPESHRTILVLRHYEGLKFREIAEVLDLPEGTVKTRMGEALNLLARNLRTALQLHGGLPGKRGRNHLEVTLV
jgi:RNA polymerase sigma-70 factor (ECF subfamily)